MNEAKHTPGPWEIQNPLNDSLWIVQAGREAFEWSCIASVSDDTSEDAYDRGASRPISTRERDANARLIAAAPDLLEAVQSLHAFVGAMFGVGADAVIPDTVPTPLGVPVKVGAIMADATAALAKAR